MTRLTCPIESVYVDRSGAHLAADVAAGASVLPVTSLVDFDEDGGSLSVNGEDHEYVSVDEDAETVTLAGTLAAAAEQDTPVFTLDANGEQEIDGWWVDVDFGDGGEPVPCAVDTASQPFFPENDESLRGQLVDVESYGPNRTHASEDTSEGWRVVSRPFQEPRFEASVVRTPVLAAYLPASQTTPGGVSKTLTGWAVDTQTTNVIEPDLATPGRFRVNEDGHYLVLVTAPWASSSTGRRLALPVWHTFIGDFNGVEDSRPGEAILGMTTHVVDVRFLAAGEAVSVIVRQSSGADLDVLGGSSQPQATIRIVKVGP